MKSLKKRQIALTSLLSTVGKNKTYVSALSVTEHPITINCRTEVGRFSFISAEQTDHLIQIDQQLTALAKSRNRQLFCGIEPAYSRRYPTQTEPNLETPPE